MHFILQRHSSWWAIPNAQSLNVPGSNVPPVRGSGATLWTASPNVSFSAANGMALSQNPRCLCCNFLTGTYPVCVVHHHWHTSPIEWAWLCSSSIRTLVLLLRPPTCASGLIDRMASILWTSVIFCGMSRWPKSLYIILWWRMGEDGTKP